MTLGDFDEVSRLLPLLLLPGEGVLVDPDCAEEELPGEFCALAIVAAHSNAAQRSEERRVGKECQ